MKTSQYRHSCEQLCRQTSKCERSFSHECLYWHRVILKLRPLESNSIREITIHSLSHLTTKNKVIRLLFNLKTLILKIRNNYFIYSRNLLINTKKLILSSLEALWSVKHCQYLQSCEKLSRTSPKCETSFSHDCLYWHRVIAR